VHIVHVFVLFLFLFGALFFVPFRSKVYEDDEAAMVIDREEHMIKWMDNEEQVFARNSFQGCRNEIHGMMQFCQSQMWFFGYAAFHHLINFVHRIYGSTDMMFVLSSTMPGQSHTVVQYGKLSV
jgi:hypothetical protein